MELIGEHVKGLLPPSEWYHVTVTLSEIINRKDGVEELSLWFTVDTGEHAWRRLEKRFPASKAGDMMIAMMCKQMGRKYFPSVRPEKRSQLFPMQFYGMRTRVYVTIHTEGEFNKNEIVKYGKVKTVAQFDVNKPKSDTHFYTNKNRRKLPLNLPNNED